MPGLTAQYGISNTSFGIVIGVGSLIYGLSRFINGFVVDRFSARVIMAVGLLLCAASNFAFGFGVNISSWLTGVDAGPDLINMLVLVMAVTIVLNQLFQGVGYPPCARLLPSWIHPSELATKMSIWNTSHSIGAALAVVVCGYIMGTMGQDLSSDESVIRTVAANLGLNPADSSNMEAILGYARHWDAWRWCFWLPACLAVAGAAWLYVGLRDDPRSVGLPELPGTKTGSKVDSGAKDPARGRFLKVMVWTNRWIWTLCIANVFVYVMRMGILDWGAEVSYRSSQYVDRRCRMVSRSVRDFRHCRHRLLRLGHRPYIQGQGPSDVPRVHGGCIAVHGYFHSLPATTRGTFHNNTGDGRIFCLRPAGTDRHCLCQPCYQGGFCHGKRAGRHIRLCRFVPFGHWHRYSGRPLGLEHGILHHSRCGCARRNHICDYVARTPRRLCPQQCVLRQREAVNVKIYYDISIIDEP